LSSDDRLRAYLKALKYAQRKDINEHLLVVFAEASKGRPGDLFVILTYFDKSSANLKHEKVRAALLQLVPRQTERLMGCLTQPFYDKGKAKGRIEGRVEGRVKGRVEGKAEALILMLETRFGALPNSARHRILSANVSEIDSWVKRSVQALDWQSVLETN
jgi:hypothetical protein